MARGTDPLRSEVDRRLSDHGTVWLATVRPNGAPHLVAIWFVPVDGSLWIATSAISRKIANLRADPRVNVSLESGDPSMVGEGTASIVPLPYPPEIVHAFMERFEWDISSGTDDDVGELALVRIDIDRWRR